METAAYTIVLDNLVLKEPLYAAKYIFYIFCEQYLMERKLYLFSKYRLKDTISVLWEFLLQLVKRSSFKFLSHEA